MRAKTLSALFFSCFFFVLTSPFVAAQSLTGEMLSSEEGNAVPVEVVTVSSRNERSRRELGTSVSVISGDDLELLGYSTVLDVLRTQTAVSASNAGGPGKVSALRIRGEESFRTRVRIDGIDVSDTSSTQVAPSVEHIATSSSIERVEVLRGPQGFIYGADSGGVVSIASRQGEGPISGRVGVELGRYRQQRLDANLSAGSDRGDFFLSLTDFETDGFNARTSDDVLPDQDGYANTTVHAKLGWNAGDNLRIELVARDLDASFEFDQCGGTHNCLGQTEQTALRASAEWGQDAFTHLTALSSTATDRRNFADDVESFSTEGRLERIEYMGSYRHSQKATLVYGVDLERQSIDPTGGLTRDRDQEAVYFEYQAAFGERWFLTLGARHDDNQDFGVHTSSRASLAYLTEVGGGTLKYRASFGTGFRAPSLSELAYNDGPFAYAPAADVLLTEESSRGFDAGIDLTTGRGARYEVTYFDQQVEDEIYFDLIDFSGYLQSRGRSESRGLELVARVPVGSHVEVFGNATFNDTSTVDDLQRIRRPKQMANLGFRWNDLAGTWSFQANYRVAGEAVDELFGIGRIAIDDYDVLDVSARYRMSETIELSLRIENLLDEQYEELAGFNTSGAAAYAGVRLSF